MEFLPRLALLHYLLIKHLLLTLLANFCAFKIYFFVIIGVDRTNFFKSIGLAFVKLTPFVCCSEPNNSEQPLCVDIQCSVQRRIVIFHLIKDFQPLRETQLERTLITPHSVKRFAKDVFIHWNCVNELSINLFAG